jgi:hypothetical protein
VRGGADQSRGSGAAVGAAVRPEAPSIGYRVWEEIPRPLHPPFGPQPPTYPAALAKGAEPEHGRAGADQFVWDGEDDPMESPAGKPSERAILRRPKRGRHPADAYAALLLAVIFHEAARPTASAAIRSAHGRRQADR